MINELKQFQEDEIRRTGIDGLQIGTHHIFGYYIEVPINAVQLVPSDWILKQTLAQVQRYSSKILQEKTDQILIANEKAIETEIVIYNRLLGTLEEFISSVRTNGQTLSKLDCLCSFAETARRYDYKKPELYEGAELNITGSRHPVIEQHLKLQEIYISNDLRLDDWDQQIILLTGPNMSGKSALLRQTALIILLAHMGSYVPASTALIPSD